MEWLATRTRSLVVGTTGWRFAGIGDDETQLERQVEEFRSYFDKAHGWSTDQTMPKGRQYLLGTFELWYDLRV